MDAKNVWIWAVGGVSVLIVSAGIFFITLPKSPSSNRPPRPGNVSTTTPTPGTGTPATPATPVTPTHTGTAPFVITTMTHMEDEFIDDENQQVFEKHVSDLRWAMDLFDEYGAKLTIETGKPFAVANTTWGTNIMKEIVDRGHGVGTHGHLGNSKGADQTQSTLNASFVSYKALVDSLVGAENNRGMSTGFGPLDWISAAENAGFDYVDGVVGFGYLSMAENIRPSGWSNSYILKTAYHDSIPPNLMDRIYPIPMKDAEDLDPDAGAKVIMMSGDIGELSSLAEGRSTCAPNCTLDKSDITVVTDDIDQILDQRDTSRFAKINMHIPADLLQKKNETILRSLLAVIKTYTDKDELSWDTMLGSYKQYIEWEK